MPDQEPEAPAFAAGVTVINASDIPRLAMERDAFHAIAHAILDNDAKGIQYLRGLARMGMLSSPDGPTVERDGEDSVDTHRLVMAALELLGVEPMDEAEVREEMRKAVTNAGPVLAKMVQEMSTPAPATPPERPN